jgi:tetratricopeptide (TPR) repeat protein
MATFVAGAAVLLVDPRHRLKAEPSSERELLLTELRATTLVGRTAELTSLQDWLNTPHQIAVRCLVGPAGAGKTRLAIELCERAEADGWAAGFARHAELARFHANHSPSEWQWPRRTLVVVDYAAASAHILRAWLEALVRRPAGPAVPQLRVLLLERHAESDSGWWAELTRPGGSSGRDPRDLLDPAAPIPLRPLAGVGDRRALLTEAMAEAARVSGITPAPVPPPLGADPLFDQRLEENVIETQPLYLMMAGIVSVRTGAPAALALSRLELADKVANADEIAGSERNRLIRLARTANVSERLLLHAAACVTLEQGCDNDSLLTLVEQECAALGFAGDAAEDLAALLRDALGAPDGSGVEAVRPDLIGEAFLLRELGHSNRTPLRAETIVERAFRRAGPRVVITVIRTAQDHAQGDANHPSVGWLDHLAHLTDEPFVLMAIADELPEQTLALRERAAEITARIVELLAPRAEIDPELIPIRAGWLNTLALRLSDLGQREAALAAAQEAVELRRALAAQHPDRFQPDLAMSLNNLASRLGDLGQREAALVAVQEAAELYRALAAQRPDAFRPDLAMSLNNLAGRLSELGQREAALAAAQDAVELRRALAILRPDTFRRDLATSLNNLANMLSNLGQREAAVAAAREAVELYRALAAHQPDAFRPDLARSLSSLVRGLSELGQRDAALTAAREAEALYRTLADQRPDAFRPRLAASLIRLAIGLRELGQRQAALAAAAEAVDLYRALTAQRPDAFQPDLAISLNNLANVLSDLGQGEAALTAAQEAVEIHRGLVAQRPDAFRPDLAMSLNNLAQVLSKLGKREAAVAVVQEAVVLYRALAARQPDAFGPDLARSLMVLSQCLDQSDCPDDGIAANSEAIATLSPMFQRVPTAFAQLIGSMARDYLERCKKLDREPDEALLAPVVAVFQALRTEQGEQR